MTYHPRVKLFIKESAFYYCVYPPKKVKKRKNLICSKFQRFQTIGQISLILCFQVHEKAEHDGSGST